VGCSYSEERGLLLEIDASGERVYSSSLQSSGSDDAFLVRIGFSSFIVSAAAALLAFRWARADRALKRVYGANVAFLAIVMLLVSLDVSVVHSIRLGDHLLLAGLLAAAIPLPFFGRPAARPR
jgi:hypothetical protein